MPELVIVILHDGTREMLRYTLQSMTNTLPIHVHVHDIVHVLLVHTMAYGH